MGPSIYIYSAYFNVLYFYTFILLDYKKHLVTGLKSKFIMCAGI